MLIINIYQFLMKSTVPWSWFNSEGMANTAVSMMTESKMLYYLGAAKYTHSSSLLTH